jgi:hypothetical protein
MAGSGALDRNEGVQAAHVGESRHACVRVDVGRQHALELGLRNELELGHDVRGR